MSDKLDPIIKEIKSSPIDKIVTPAAMDQINQLVFKLKDAERIHSKMFDSVAGKIQLLSDVLGNLNKDSQGIVDLKTYHIIIEKLKPLIESL